MVLVQRLADVNLPTRQTTGAAGFDVEAAAESIVPARGHVAIATGIAVELPPGMEAQVRPRSGLAARHGIGLLNAPGTIDSDFRGEIKVVLFNITDRDFHVARGDRIAQLVFSRVADVELRESPDLGRTARGPGGFGHTGR